MANFNNTATTSAEELGLLHGMGFDCVSMPPKRHLKELARPPVDLFASSSGLYIPPEETQTEVPSDDINGWGFTDDEQNDTDDEDMDDNEFDTDFAEADFPPPIGIMDDVDQRGFDNDAALGYAQIHPNSAYANLPSSAFIQPDNSNPAYMNGPPVSFVDPNSLHLSNDPKIFNENSNPDAVTLHSSPSSIAYPEINSMSSPSNLAPHIEDPKQLEIGMNEFDMDLEMDDLYAPMVDEFTSYEQPCQPEHAPMDSVNSSHPPYMDQHNAPEMEMAPSNYTQPMSHDHGSILPPPPRPQDTTEPENLHEDLGMEKPAESKSSPSETMSASPVTPPMTQEHIPSPPMSPVYEKPRRKMPARRKARTTHGTQHSGAHVCTMRYHDGAECNRSFTRPYDLARHQETSHAAVRKTYTCEACGSNSKTFSRLDASSRHMRSKHS